MNISYAKAPSVQDCINNQYSVRQVAEEILGLQEYDAALPQEWVDECLNAGYDPRGSFVWAYGTGQILGSPFPLTKEAALECPAELLLY